MRGRHIPEQSMYRRTCSMHVGSPSSHYRWHMGECSINLFCFSEVDRPTCRHSCCILESGTPKLFPPCTRNNVQHVCCVFLPNILRRQVHRRLLCMHIIGTLATTFALAKYSLAVSNTMCLVLQRLSFFSFTIFDVSVPRPCARGYTAWY